MFKLKEISNIEAVLRFGRVFSPKLSADENMEIAIQRLAELDLVVNIIGEYRLKHEELTHLEKLRERKNSVCDFKLIVRKKVVYLEAKYVSKLSKIKIESVAKEALAQIKNTDREIEKTGGIIWIFSYDYPNSSAMFQNSIKSIELESNFPYSINIQSYKQGLFGTGPIVF